MSRYIDAEYVKAVMINDRLMQGNAEINLYMQQVETQVKAMPSIDIVLCKECIHFDGFDCNRFGEPAEYNNPCSDDGNDFCSYGERREP